MSTNDTPPVRRDDAILDRALDDLRRDLGALRPAPGLADRVVEASLRGDSETRRFHLFARIYAAAAALLLLLGTAGALAMRRPPADPRGALADLEATRMALEQAVSVADLAVGGR